MSDQAVTHAVNAASASLSELDEDQKKQVIKKLGGIVNPPVKTDLIWIILILALCVCLILAAVRISGVIPIITGDYVTLANGKPAFLENVKLVLPDVDKVMIMFSSLVGFLAGLFVPSPVKSSDQA